MNRDNALFLLFGVLCGFIVAYMVFDRTQSLHPQPRIHGEESAASAPATGGAAGPAAGGAPMQVVQELRERVAKDPNDAVAVLDLANMNFDISNWKRAQELYEQYLSLRPGAADVYSDLGICLRAQGEYVEALGAFDTALEQDPDHWYARFNKAIVLGIDQGNIPAAEEALARLREIRPEAPELARLAEELAKRRPS